jgi:hypothetical protein
MLRVSMEASLWGLDILGPILTHPFKCFESEALSFELHATGFGFVQNEAFKRIEVARPRRLS